jgi:hypothetical protein
MNIDLENKHTAWAFFADKTKSLEDCSSIFKSLTKQWHPDRAAQEKKQAHTALFQAINFIHAEIKKQLEYGNYPTKTYLQFSNNPNPNTRTSSQSTSHSEQRSSWFDQEVNSAYARASARANAKGKTNTKPGKDSAKSATPRPPREPRAPRTPEQEALIQARLNLAVQAIKGLRGITHEILGVWIWLNESSHEIHKPTLQAAGYRFSVDKNKWYFAGENSPSRGKRRRSYDRIKSKYGARDD